MTEIIDVKWNDNMNFSSTIDGHTITVDALPESGGLDKGPRPKPFMLLALGGCTGMDVVSILKKMRVELDDLNIRVEAEMTDEHPKHYTKMTLIYSFKGKNLEIEKLTKAVELSEERYCGVMAVYKKVMEVSYKIEIL